MLQRRRVSIGSEVYSEPCRSSKVERFANGEGLRVHIFNESFFLRSSTVCVISTHYRRCLIKVSSKFSAVLVQTLLKLTITTTGPRQNVHCTKWKLSFTNFLSK